MGLNSPTSRNGGGGAAQRLLRQRFAAQFPQLFAYASSCVADAAAAKEVVAQAFCRAFAGSPLAGDGEFRLLLFGEARRLCRSLGPSRARPRAGLSEREREVLALLFDAGLPPAEVARLLRVAEPAVGACLLRGLRKLRDQTGPALTAAPLQGS